MRARTVLLVVLAVTLALGLTACGGTKRTASTPSRATSPPASKQPRGSRQEPQLLHNSAPGVGCYPGKSFSDGLDSPPITVYACPIEG